MHIGMIGAGMVALAVAREALAKGHQVVLSSRSGPAALAGKVAELGPGALAATVQEAAALDYVLKPPIYVVDTARLEDVLRQMQKAKAHFGFVIDEHGGVEGIITLEDLLEEIVGDISDEHDEEVNEQITKIDSRTYELDGALAVRDLNRRLKTALPESETYITIGGFLMTEAGHVLQPGEIIQHDGLRFHVEKVERRRLLRVRLELPEPRAETRSEDGGGITKVGP